MTGEPTNTQPGRFERVVADLAGRRLVWVAVIATVVAMPLVKAFTAKLPDPPPKLRQIPAFELTNQDGAPYGTRQLDGKLWVANFIYTSCGTVCPKLTATLAEVKHRARNLRGVVEFVSFSVDPRRDTPSVLAAYAKRAKARGDWNFLTGSVGDVTRVVKEGFGLGVGRHEAQASSLVEQGASPDPAAELFEISHGEKLVLVDKDLWIRGSYSIDPSSIDRLLLDIGLIANLEGVGVDPMNPFGGKLPASASQPQR